MMNHISEVEKQQLDVGSSEKTTALFSKGRERSLILSDFLVAHPDNAFFEVIESEWSEVVAKHLELLKENQIDYELVHISHRRSHREAAQSKESDVVQFSIIL